MRILLVSIFLITLMGMIFIPNAFGITQIVKIPIGASSGDHFDPNIIEIEKDDTVKWANLDRNTIHTVTSTSTNWTVDSGDLLPNNDENYCYPNCKPSFSYTFDAGGTYDYECKIHSWMKGVVKVIEFGQDAEIKIHGYAGDMYIDKSQYEVIVDDNVEIKIYGEVKNPGAGDSVDFIITKPDGSTNELKTYRTGEGYYQLILSVNYEDRGTYNVVSTFGVENIGTANFVVVERPNPTIENPFPPSDDESTNVSGSSQGGLQNTLTIGTDFPSYTKGNMIKISGTVPYHVGGKLNTVQLIIQIFDPRNNLVTVSQFFPNEDRTYFASINSNGPMWKFEGDYIIRTSYALEQASTKFFLTHPGNTFNPQSPVPSTQSKTSTLLTLNPLPNYFETTVKDAEYSEELPLLKASIYVSGKLTTKVEQRGIAGAHVGLVVTPVAYGGVENESGHIFYGAVTDNNGEFETNFPLPTFEDMVISYSIYADYDVESDRGAISNYVQLHDEIFHSSQSQIEYFDVRLGSIQSAPLQPESPPLEVTNWGAMIFWMVIIAVIVGVVIRKIKRKKKIQPPPTIPSGGGTPGGGTPGGGTPGGGTPGGGTPGGGTPKIWGYSPGGGTLGRRSAQAGAKVISNPFGGSSIWKLIGKPPIVPGGLKKAVKKAAKKAAKKKSKIHNPKYDIRCKKCQNENLIDGMDGLQTCSDPTCGWRNQ